MTNRIGIWGIFVSVFALALAGWAVPSQASKFTEALSKDYFKLARVQYYYSHDRFAVKARAADKGKNVLPDNPGKQKLKLRDRRRLQASYERLMRALKGGFRSQNPKAAARAATSHPMRP